MGFGMGFGCCGGTTPQTLVVVTAASRTSGTSNESPSTVATTSVNGSWSVTAGNLYVQQDSSAGVDSWNSSVGLDGDILDALDFRYKIPSWATITNISVQIWRAASVSGNLKDKTVQLVVNGTPTGNNKASAAGTYGTTLGFNGVIYSGAPVSYWGLASVPSPSDVMAANFGVRFQAQASSAIGAVTVSVDRVDIIISWTIPSGGEVIAMDGDMNYLWIASLGTPPSLSSAWISSPPLIDGDGNIFVRGEAQTASGPNKHQVQVRKFDKDGNFVWDWNSGNIPGAAVVQAGQQTVQTCFDLNGNILVPHRLTDTGNYFLTVLDLSGSVVSQFSYPGGSIPAGLNMAGTGPVGIGVDSSNNFYVGAGSGGGGLGYVLVIDSSGNYINHAFRNCQSITVDSVRDIIYYRQRVDTDFVNPAPNSAVVVAAKDFSGGGNIGPAGGTATTTWTRSFSQIQSGLPTNSPARQASPVQHDIDLLSGNIYGGALCMNSGGNTHVQLASNIHGLDSSGGVTWNARLAPTDFDSGSSTFDHYPRYSAVNQNDGHVYMLNVGGVSQGALSSWVPGSSDRVMGLHFSGLSVFGVAVRTF